MTEDNKDKYKKIVEDIFDSLEGSKSKIDPKDLKNSPKQSDDIADECIGLALDELDEIREIFIEFQEELSHFAVGEYLMGPIASFADFAKSIVQILEEDIDNINKESFEPHIQKKITQLVKLKAQILSSIYNKYYKKKKK